MMIFKNYYDVFGMSKDSFDRSELKRLFRSLSKQYHPDIHKDPAAAEKMKEMTEAYHVLKDEEKRREYDRIYDQRQAELRAEGATRFRPEGQRTYPSGASPQKERPRGWQNQSSPGPREAERSKTRPSDEWFSTFYRDCGFEDFFRNYGQGLDEMMRQAAMGNDIFAGWGMGRKSSQDWIKEERERAQRESETGKARALAEKITLPEEDVYLVSAMMRLLKDRSLQKAEVRNEKGDLIWEVRLYNPQMWVIRRTLLDYVDARIKPKIDLGWKGKRRPSELFEVDDIDHLTRYGGISGPKAVKDYVQDLERIAEKLMEPGMPRIFDSLVAEARGIKRYLEENRDILKRGRMREATIGRINEGLDESRIRIFQGAHEGKPRVV